MKAVAICGFVALLAASIPASAAADTDYFGKDRPKDDLTYRVERSRTPRQRIIIGALLGGAVVFGGLGVYFHLDARDKASQVSLVGDHSGLVWTQEREDIRRSSVTSSWVAAAGYAVGGALLIATFAVVVKTQPGADLVKADGERADPIPVSVAPVSGGLMVARGWSF